MKITLKKALFLTLFVLVLTALFVVGANAATYVDDVEKSDTTGAVAKVEVTGDDNLYYYTALGYYFNNRGTITGEGAIYKANTVADGTITITLLTDAELTASTYFAKDVTIDGNGKEITVTGRTQEYVFHSGGRTVTLQNLTMNVTDTAAANLNFVFDSSGTFTISNSTVTAAKPVARVTGGTLTVENSTLTAKSGDTIITFLDNANRTINIAGSDIISKTGNAINVSTGTTTTTTTINITGIVGQDGAVDRSTLVAKSHALHFSKNATVAVFNAELTSSDTPIYVYAGTVAITLNDGAVIDRASALLSANELELGEGPAIHNGTVDAAFTLTLNGTAKISGSAGKMTIWIGNSKSYEVKFGTGYSGSKILAVDQTSLFGTGGCRIYFFDDLSAAIANVDNENKASNIMLLADLSLTEAVTVDKSVTINGQGKTITSTAASIFCFTSSIVILKLSNVTTDAAKVADVSAKLATQKHVTESNGVYTVLTHTTAADDCDCTTAITCTICGMVTTAAKEAHTPGEGEEENICMVCGSEIPVEEEPQKMGVGLIVGIVVGAAVVLGGGGFALYWFVIRKKKAK